MVRPRIAMAFGAVFAVVAASGQGVTAAGASTPLPASAQIASASPDKAQLIAAEQSQAASAGQALGIGSGEKLVVKDVITDADGTIHVRYNRTFNGLRVIGGDLVSHRDRSGKIKSVNWNAARTVGVASVTPKISLASAKAVGARKASSVQKTTSATKGELVVYAPGISGTSGKATPKSPKATPKLAYDVLTQGIRADQTPSRLHTIVDASTGATLLSYDEIENGTGHGVLVGNVTIGTTNVPPWTMRDTVGNYTTDLNNIFTTGTGTTFTDADNTWGTGAVTDRASAAVDAQYGAEKTFDYFKIVQGRNGIGNNGVGAPSRVHYGSGYVNAFWDGTRMTYGDGTGDANPLTEIDVAGHEMTHGVTENTAGLVYAGESGGLNEATSDIFGTAVEFYADNASDIPDYLLGEKLDLNGDGTPLRYMDEPSKDGASPDCWSPTVGDLDVHWSSGPLNHWFYLASEGSGQKTINGVDYDSPTCDASTVTGVGRAAAEKIWYRTLTVYLTSSNTYAAAREGAIQSAKDLYGATSTQCTTVAAAFSAISVPQGAATCTVTPPPPVGSNLLQNPGFESGNTLWSASQDVIDQWGGSAAPRTGTWDAWLLGYGSDTYQSIAQLVTIPAGRTATLSYYVHIDTDQAPGDPAHDTMTVYAGSTALQTLSNVNAAAGYQLKTVSLSAYAGRTISLSFAGAEDSSLQTSFVLDDLSVTPGSSFTPLATARVFDGTATTTPRQVQIANLGGVPAGATAVVVNTEVFAPTAAGYVRVTPAGVDAGVAVQQFAAGQAISNLVVVKLVGGKVQVKVSAGSARILMDVSGYYSSGAGASYTPLSTARVFDGTATTTPRQVQIANLGGVPAGATAVVVNTEVFAPTAAGYVRVTPAGLDPSVAVQEFGAGKAISNLVVVKLVGGKIQVKVSAGSARILMDVSGYYSAGTASFTPLSTSRVFDGTATTTPRQVQIAGLGGVPANATAVVVNTEVFAPTAAGYVRVTPFGLDPSVAVQEFGAGQAISNLVVVKLVGGKIQVKVSAGSARILMDVSGYYS